MRRPLFALFGLVLPVAAFTASPVSAASSSSLQDKPAKHHVSASHKAKKPHGQVHRASHRTHHTTPKASAS